MTEETPTAELRTGQQEAAPLVLTVTLSLRSLTQERPLAFYDLVMIARGKIKKAFGSNQEHLIKLGLLERNGSIHDSILAIVMASAEGEGLQMKLFNPLSDKGREQMREFQESRTKPHED